ncbi:plasmid recombination protein [Citrobacter cronae]|uniref:plasmid recombination protein n=1 Tax=Citrobacter cronae TaxID=1748967 RepID=UPI00388D0391
MKFSLAIDKMKATDVGRAAGHNCRLHPTASQLPQGSWFTDKGRHEVVAWRPDVIAKAKSLSKRKDAVVAISIVLQVGNQLDWREKETPDCPEGRPKGGKNNKDAITMIGHLAKAARDWANKEFGEENVVGVDLHTDESSPHVHVVVTPVHDGKLQAKNWLDGAARCAKLRKRAHQEVLKYIECEYVPGQAGGAPHDPEQAAGRIGRIARRDRALNEREEALNKREEALFEREAEIAEREVALYQREQNLKKRESDLDALAEQVATSTPEALKNRNKRLQGLINELPDSLIRDLSDKDLRQSIRSEQSSKNKDGYERN